MFVCVCAKICSKEVPSDVAVKMCRGMWHSPLTTCDVRAKREFRALLSIGKESSWVHGFGSFDSRRLALGSSTDEVGLGCLGLGTRNRSDIVLDQTASFEGWLSCTRACARGDACLSICEKTLDA